MEDCIFCKVISGEIPGTFLFQDDEIAVFKDINPQAPVHWLVVPKKHISEFIEGDDQLLNKLTLTIKKIINDEKISPYRIVNNGKGAALIDHLHFHVLGKVDKFRKL